METDTKQTPVVYSRQPTKLIVVVSAKVMYGVKTNPKKKLLRCSTVQQSTSLLILPGLVNGYMLRGVKLYINI